MNINTNYNLGNQNSINPTNTNQINYDEKDPVQELLAKSTSTDGFLHYDNSQVLKAIEEAWGIDTAYVGEPFEKGLKQTWEYIQGQTRMPYGIIAPENVDTSEELPVMIFMHGAQEGSIIYERGFGRLANKEDLEGFKGYILCPANTGESWQGSASNLVEILDDFSKTHAIDMDNIALSGFSLGACAVPTILKSNEFNGGSKYQFSKAAIFAGYNSTAAKQGDIPTEMAVWVGAGDTDSINSMKTNLRRLIKDENYHVVAGAGHSAFSSVAMAQDVDGNGRSDVLEWLFSDEE